MTANFWIVSVSDKSVTSTTWLGVMLERYWHTPMPGNDDFFILKYFCAGDILRSIVI